jgi:hypothetical protein
MSRLSSTPLLASNNERCFLRKREGSRLQGNQERQAAFTGRPKEKLEYIFFEDFPLNASRFGGVYFNVSPTFPTPRIRLKHTRPPFLLARDINKWVKEVIIPQTLIH